MSSVPIVHGVPLDNVYKTSSPYQHSYNTQDDPELNSDRQNPIKKYQDVVWAIAFVVHLFIVCTFIALGMQNSPDGAFYGSHGAIMFTVSVTGLSAIGLSCSSLAFMMNNSESLVQTALVFSVCSSLAVGILGFMMGSLLMGILGLISFATGICYAKAVWPRIPFAAANLKTALTAVRQNIGLAAVSILLTAVAFVWTIFWFFGVGDSLGDNNLATVFLLFFSYYWVHQVLQNTMHVTTAGTVATWWFIPDEASSWWSQALSDSLYRSLTYSFGSICFGSLLVALVQALRALEHYTRENDDFQFLGCIIQCILSCIESIIESINRWAYIYVGMYGFSYLDAGRSVVELFQNKGWTVVITDDLADNVLFMIAVAIGLASGLVGLILGYMNASMFADFGYEQAHGPAFVIGLLSGFLFSSVILSVVGSAINTVIVCYAEDPASFQANHPQLAANMRAAWVEAWPGIVM